MNIFTYSLFGTTVYNLLMWGVFGIVVGAIANTLVPGEVKGGVIATAVFGVLGAVVGGYLASLLFGVGIITFTWQGIVTAVVGALLLALIHRVLFRNSGHFRTTSTNFS